MLFTSSSDDYSSFCVALSLLYSYVFEMVDARSLNDLSKLGDSLTIIKLQLSPILSNQESLSRLKVESEIPLLNLLQFSNSSSIAYSIYFLYVSRSSLLKILLAIELSVWFIDTVKCDSSSARSSQSLSESDIGSVQSRFSTAISFSTSTSSKSWSKSSS